MPNYVLGIDNGGTVAKAGLFTLDGQEVAVSGRKTEMISPCPGHTERDMDSLWQATADAIREVVTSSKVAPADIACVAPCGHGNGLYLIDAHGRPVRNGIYSTDSRAKEYVARWHKSGVASAVLPRTMQSLWPGQPNALLAWLMDHEPQTLRQARWVLMCKDFVRFRLTGEVHAEITDWSGNNLISVRDGGYDQELLEAFGLSQVREMLPPIYMSHEICGVVTSQAASQTGLAQGTPVAAGLFDIDACGLGCGIVDESQMCMIAGTWSVNQYISRTPVIDPDLFMCSRYCIPGYFLVPEASATSASNLEWFVSQFLQAEDAAARQRGSSAYEVANQWVAAARPEAANIVFLPFLFGSNAQPDAKACLIGLNGWHNRGDVLRAIYEGVAFGHKAHTDRLMRFRAPPQTIRLTGGAARSEVWVRIFADVFQTPVEVPAGTELGALGSAICASVAAGCHAGFQDAVAAMVKIARTQPPDPTLAALYQSKYRRYRTAIETIGPLWDG